MESRGDINSNFNNHRLQGNNGEDKDELNINKNKPKNVLEKLELKRFGHTFTLSK